MKIIDLCRVVEKKGLDPFEIDVTKSLQTLKRYLPSWRRLDDLLLDAEALKELSTIVKLQCDWIKHRASSLYIDPLLIELKVKLSTNEELAEVFLKSWHPTVTLNQISPSRLKAGLDYWNALIPLSDRFRDKFGLQLKELGVLSIDALIKSRILSDEEFSDLLERIRCELRERAGVEGEIDYWDFIFSEDFSETVVRAYLTSFLITQGYATLKVDPIEDTISISPTPNTLFLSKHRLPRSLATAFDYTFWSEYKKKAMKN